MKLEQLHKQVADIEAQVAARVRDTHAVGALRGLETAAQGKTACIAELLVFPISEVDQFRNERLPRAFFCGERMQ